MKHSYLLFLAPVFLIALVACRQLSSNDPVEMIGKGLQGIWVVEYIAARPVVDRSPARIHFAEDGTLNGNASCNRFFGKYRYNEQDLIIEPLGSTRMACVPALMEQEQRFMEALPRAVRAHLENDLLTLFDAAGTPVLKAVRDETDTL